MKGSLRQRGAASWELRVYAGTNPDTGKRRYRTATVTGNRADAERALARLVAEVQSDKSIGSNSTVSELLEAWFSIASTSWAPTTTRETRSILDRCLHPHLGHLRVGDVTTCGHRRHLRHLARARQRQGRPAQAGDAQPDPRRIALRLLAGDAVGMGVGQPRRTSPPHRRPATRDAPPDTHRIATPPRPHPDPRHEVSCARVARRDHRRPSGTAARADLGSRSR